MSSEPEATRVALVTGGSGGIGRDTAVRLATDGFRVVVNYAGHVAEADAVVADRRRWGPSRRGQGRSGGRGGSRSHVRHGGAGVRRHRPGRPLGRNHALAPLADLDLDVLDRVLRTNLRGTFVVAQQAVRRVRPGCAIIKFSSSVLGLALPNYSAYAASKGGVEAITLIVARELRGRDVTINAIAPGPTATPLFLNGKDEETIERFAFQPPLERLGMPSDIVEAVAFLAGPGHWVNGQVLRVNGGID